MSLKTKSHPWQYAESLIAYKRRKTVTVNIGDVPLGSDYPIRVQSMTTVDTMDTEGSIEQTIRMVDAGCEYVRITAPSLKEAKNLENIRKGLRERGYDVPLIADIHFTPNAAEMAARLVEKVRINPGNYADKKRFELIEYNDDSYNAELARIRDKFVPLVKICKEYGTAMRIGTNHGSLSDRIMSRYGDTPIGMVESALEFLRICEDESFHNIVLSMKASNPQVMIQAYRLLVQKMDEEGLKPYPLHLGVTEAGDGEDGRIKSAVGIGALLEDGLGDTVRVSLTEEPEHEAPVAANLINRYHSRLAKQKPIPAMEVPAKDPYTYEKRQTAEALNFGADNVPRVIADFSRMKDIQISDLKNIGHFYLPEPDKWSMNDHGADYVYTGDRKIGFMLPNGLKEIVNLKVWEQLSAAEQQHAFPMLDLEAFYTLGAVHPALNFLSVGVEVLDDTLMKKLQAAPNLVLVLSTENGHAMPALRRGIFQLMEAKLDVPVVIRQHFSGITDEQLMLFAATDAGALFTEGLGDGIMLSTSEGGRVKLDAVKLCNSISFGILQAARARMTKTEYISCPSCGRTLFDLQETTAMIRKRTDHLKGVKIGIMGCIVNGPGEMADADYGYVGSGKGKITLYRGQEVVKRNVPSEKAVDELIGLIREDGKWLEPAVANL